MAIDLLAEVEEFEGAVIVAGPEVEVMETIDALSLCLFFKIRSFGGMTRKSAGVSRQFE